MKIHVRYLAQLKRAAGAGLADLLARLAEIHGDSLRSHLFDERGTRRRSLLISFGDRMLSAGDEPPLTDGATITLMTPMSGG